jgi:hypothetical protein
MITGIILDRNPRAVKMGFEHLSLFVSTQLQATVQTVRTPHARISKSSRLLNSINIEKQQKQTNENERKQEILKINNACHMTSKFRKTRSHFREKSESPVLKNNKKQNLNEEHVICCHAMLYSLPKSGGKVRIENHQPFVVSVRRQKLSF